MRKLHSGQKEQYSTVISTAGFCVPAVFTLQEKKDFEYERRKESFASCHAARIPEKFKDGNCCNNKIHGVYQHKCTKSSYNKKCTM